MNKLVTFFKSRSFSIKVLIGLSLGILTGLLFGYRVAFLSRFGDAFIGLLQMTVLPYIMFSLIVSIGRSTRDQGKKVFLRASLVLTFLLLLGLVALIFIPLALPKWGGGHFYSEKFLAPPESIDLIDYYIPSNPFASLSTNVVPAVVLFSIFLGLAVMSIPRKEDLLKSLDVLCEALNRINKQVIKLTPFGVYAISAGLVVKLSLLDLMQLQTYLTLYSFSVVFFLFLILPGLIFAFTPFSPREIYGIMRPTLITIFVTGKIIVVLPQLIDNIKEVLATREMRNAETEATVEVLIPLALTFPNLGTLLAYLFIPFSAWYMGTPLPINDYPAYLSNSLVGSFVSPVIGLSFALDVMGLEKNTFQFFVVSVFLNDRLRVLLGAAHLIVLSLLTFSLLKRKLKVHLKSFVFGSLLIVVFAIGGGFGLQKVLEQRVKHIPTNRDRVNSFNLITDERPHVIYERSMINPTRKQRSESILARIKRRDTLRVGIYQNTIPFSFFNDKGKLVGYSVDMAHLLAEDLGVKLEFLPISHGKLKNGIRNDHFDIVLSDIFLTHNLASQISLSDPFMDVTLALLVKKSEHRLDGFLPEYELDTFNIAFFERKDVGKEFLNYYPNSNIYRVDSYDEFFKQSNKEIHFDGIITSAEKAYAYTVFYTDYKVVNPFPHPIRIGLTLPLAKDKVWKAYVDNWIKFRTADGSFNLMYDQWILGKTNVKEIQEWNMLDNMIFPSYSRYREMIFDFY